MLFGDNGVLKKAVDAKETTRISQIQEQINLAYHTAVVDELGTVTEDALNIELTKEFGEDGYTLDTSNNSTWKVTVDDVEADLPSGTSTGNIGGGNSNTEAPDLLKDYVLGEAVGGVRPGKDLTTIFDPSTSLFIDDVNTVEHASTEIVLLNECTADIINAEAGGLILYAKYNNAAYRIFLKIVDNFESYTTSELVKVYEPDANSRVGQVVQYSVDGVSPVTDWLILYDNGSTLDIMSLNTMGSYELGYGDPNASGADAWATGMDSYNNAVSRLNIYCGTLVTNSTAQKTRSVGTQFDINDDTTAKYSSTFLESNPANSPGTYNGVMKTGDMNAEQDVVRMSYYSRGGTGSGYQAPGYAATSNLYWLASRCIIEGTDSVLLGVKYVNERGSGTLRDLWAVYGDSDGPMSSRGYAVRPVVRVATENVSGL